MPVAGTTHRPARLIAGGAGLLGLSVLVDSALEHYRGSFRDPAMVAPLASAIAIIFTNGRRTMKPSRPGGTATDIAAITTGVTGFGFHVWNVSKRPGSVDWTNLLYGAPVGAPGALVLAGAAGAAAGALANNRLHIGLLDIGPARAVAALAAVGIAGTVSEAALLHFRGAYHNPVMWLPVTVPPVAALSLARDALAGTSHPATTPLLAATAVLGIAGVGFHSWGVHRNMGGWRNWRQNILAGPPIPAPPAFTALALIGLAALLLMARRRG